MLDSNLMLKTSAAETSSTNGTTKNFGNMVANQALVFVALCTAASGTSPTLDLKIQGSPDGSNWQDIHVWPQKTTTFLERAAYRGPFSQFRYVSTIGGTSPSFTYQVGVELGGEYEDF